MTHKPIQLKDFDLSFAHKTCFESFTCQIIHGSRIAIIGRNGSGKSTLLRKIASVCSKDVTVGYVPQIVTDHQDLSGGQRFNKSLTEALALDPDILLLDEPTNHLDIRNRKSLMRMLLNYSGTLIIVSHDREILRSCVDTFWHLDNGKVQIFSGNYDDYMREIHVKRASVERELELLNRQKEGLHDKLMQEQQRIAKSKASGEKKIKNRQWDKVGSGNARSKAEKSQGKKLQDIDKTRDDLNDKLAELRLPEVIVPKFSIKSTDSRGVMVQVTDGSVGYCKDKSLLSGINFRLQDNDRVAITGDNGGGKSTLIKAIVGDNAVHKTGKWDVVKADSVGYLDQHYSTLNADKTVLEIMTGCVPNWPYSEVRRHLNDFLFRKNEEVAALVSTLSGREKARLSLAQIAAKTPKLLILDEITNNLDLETTNHVIQILKVYPGAMIVISHDDDFLKQIGVNEMLDVKEFV